MQPLTSSFVCLSTRSEKALSAVFSASFSAFFASPSLPLSPSAPSAFLPHFFMFSLKASFVSFENLSPQSLQSFSVTFFGSHPHDEVAMPTTSAPNANVVTPNFFPAHMRNLPFHFSQPVAIARRGSLLPVSRRDASGGDARGGEKGTRRARRGQRKKSEALRLGKSPRDRREKAESTRKRRRCGRSRPYAFPRARTRSNGLGRCPPSNTSRAVCSSKR